MWNVYIYNIFKRDEWWEFTFNDWHENNMQLFLCF